ncbi:uncharacterized protein LOC122247096 isoform X2 [Penaeus japonicus]|uniref:uncharacterized protein LOC122247096 isoform X2 n=1 Tax=Penaeus japonicus TaxID=27405 RepID=UPI001C710611|nr:uncharacterized protein LOC122247096 isoform X2 [Penaeus japonicus]
MEDSVPRALLLVWAVTEVALAAPTQDLPLEHRGAADEPQALPDITSNLPAASPDLFIWTDPDGTYRFGMQSDDQWRVETRDANGVVTGRYVYLTPDGQTVDVSYNSGPQGYRATGDAIPGGAAPLDQERPAVAYGALSVAGQQMTMPGGHGVTTYSDSEATAIVTDITEPEDSRLIVYPIVSNVLGSSGLVVGPPTVSDEPVLSAAILA